MNIQKKYYQEDERNNKYKFISQCFKNKVNKVLDLGCNNGEYSKLALKSGCGSVVGLDYDLNSMMRLT